MIEPDDRARREGLRATFEAAAADYHQARPRYPDELFDKLVELADLDGPADLLEIGCAGGTATVPLAERGHRVTCVELGPDLAKEARRNLASFTEVFIVNQAFETWTPPAWGSFDLVFAATAWHWLDPAVRYEQAHRHLRPGGSLAFWSANHVVPEGGDTFFADIQTVYEEIGLAGPGDEEFPRPGQLPDLSPDIEATGLFAMTGVTHFDWEMTYDADTYIRLLDTFSGHIALAPWQRHRLYGEIRRRLADRSDETLRRHWGAVLHVARRVSALGRLRDRGGRL